MNNRKEIIKHISGLAIVFALLFAVMMAGYIRIVLPASDAEKYFLKNLQKYEEIAIEDLGSDFYQLIKINGETLERVEIPITCKNENSESILTISLSDNDKIIQTWSCKFDDEEETMFELQLDEPYFLDDASNIKVSFNTSDYVKGTGAVWSAYWDVLQTESYTAGAKNDFDITMSAVGGTCGYIIPLFWILCAGLTAGYIFFSYILLKKKWDCCKVFVLLAGLFGVIYTFYWSPYACPDEYQHINTAYYYSSCILDEETVNEDGETLFREADMAYAQGEILTNRYSYYLIVNDLFDNPSDSEIENTTSMRWQPMTNVLPISYLPQILIITLVRLVGGGNLIWLLGGRLAALSLYLFLGYHALKRMPFAKMAMMILMLGPTAIQQAASFSYDSILNGCAFFFVAYVLYAAYEKEKVTWKDVSALFLTSCVFVSSKVVYFPMLLCLFLIPSRKISKFPWKAYLVKGSIMLLSFLSGFVSRMSQIQTMAGESTHSNMDVEGYTLMTILQNPLKTIVLWANTLRERPVYYIQQVFGGYEAYSKISISWLIILGFWIILVLALLVKENQKIISWKGKMISIISSAGCLGLILLTFNLAKDCTNLTSPCIYGVQGRYFLPFLPLIFAVLQSKSIIVKKSIDFQLNLSVFCLQFLTVCSIFETVVGR